MRNFFQCCIHVAHRLGISPLMLRARKTARKQQAKLSFAGNIIQWERGDLTVRLPSNLPYRAHHNILDMERILQFAIPGQAGADRMLDLSQPCRYRTYEGKKVWLPIPVEQVDSCKGYFAKGGPAEGDIAIDAGAYCGEVTLELAQKVGPTGHVYSLEPDPKNRKLLEQNIAEHQLSNVTIIPRAFWHETIDLVFISHGDYGSSLKSMFNRKIHREHTITVLAISPADLFAQMGCMPDFIKMDIEGAEVEVIPELGRLLAKADRPVRMAIASYHLRDNRPTHEWITPPLREAGFQVETGYWEHATTWASLS